MTTEKAGEKDKVIQMVPRTTEEELRAEIDELKRQLEASNQSRAGEGHALAHPKQPSRKAIGVFGFLAIAALLVAFVAGYLPRHRRDLQLVAEANAQSGEFPQVSVVTAARASANGELVLPGNIQAVTEAPILARADGFVKKRFVDIGDRVTQGQLLAEIEAPDLDQQVRQAEASVQQAQSDLERSSAALEQGKANE
jgi:multidrug efflux pump subunit AcrA (membrane-fusion protein)